MIEIIKTIKVHKIFIINSVFICQLFLFCTNAYSQSVDSLDGLVKIPLDIYKSRNPDSPTIIYGHGCSGYDNFDMQKARLIRSWGYNVVVAEYTKGRGLNNKNINGRNITCVQGFSSYPMQQRADDLIAVGNWVKKQEWHKGKIGVIGFSLGGGAVEFLINDTKAFNIFSAGVSFYPYCRYSLSPDGNTLPNQFHIGSQDEAFNRCIDLNKEITRHTFFVYDNATHAFDNNWAGQNKNGYLYDKESATIAFERVKVFFDNQVKN